MYHQQTAPLAGELYHESAARREADRAERDRLRDEVARLARERNALLEGYLFYRPWGAAPAWCAEPQIPWARFGTRAEAAAYVRRFFGLDPAPSEGDPA